ncbi:MAG: hypothetical protein XD76_1110 [candidate division TA06 bacterium 32_111]|uniref:DUF4956 domain-containing protein n=2 Tax=Bacteria candidate phyla TaxID=1783234 RepID=A0A124G0G6_UNCT6|nr:MAG: hypothetical protein XD76_1110 [candidate division TA06 bacterium 32_111]KUK87445.1 MAG: hypothetical protein XE03_0612 [candidate division TA06 bacterium 34_109]HAF08218.1 DUF4956 domain-containing protein [candidate division WOR-3 bacterium]HCP16780.1 DUF4956 domain-containing protein [candidate division WOR-3 bacterium]
MNKIQTFEEFLTNQSAQMSIWTFAINLIITIILSFILSRIYIKYGTTISNRKQFAGNFILLAVTTMLVISIVKSSLALSLGLVGALSIVRFRSAIKEPEELTYLFLCLAIGLGMGANQMIITIVAMFFVFFIIWIRHLLHKIEYNQDLIVTIVSEKRDRVDLEKIIEILKKNAREINLRRFDDNKNLIEATFIVEFDQYKNMEEMKKELKKLDEDIKISFIDNKGII